MNLIIAEILHGVAGQAIRVTPDWKTPPAFWYLRLPPHPSALMWVLRLGPITYEFVVAGLDPAAHPSAVDDSSWRFTHPLYLTRTPLRFPDYPAAAEFVHRTAQVVVDGGLTMDPECDWQGWIESYATVDEAS